MTEHENRVVESFRAVYANKGVDPPALDPSSRLDDGLGLDSIDFAELVVRLESEFGHDPFSEDDAPTVKTIGELADLYAV